MEGSRIRSRSENVQVTALIPARVPIGRERNWEGTKGGWHDPGSLPGPPQRRRHRRVHDERVPGPA